MRHGHTSSTRHMPAPIRPAARWSDPTRPDYIRPSRARPSLRASTQSRRQPRSLRCARLVALLGSGTRPACSDQRTRTCAGVFPYLAAAGASAGSRKRIVRVSGEKACTTTPRRRHQSAMSRCRSHGMHLPLADAEDAAAALAATLGLELGDVPLELLLQRARPGSAGGTGLQRRDVSDRRPARDSPGGAGRSCSRLWSGSCRPRRPRRGPSTRPCGWPSRQRGRGSASDRDSRARSWPATHR